MHQPGLRQFSKTIFTAVGIVLLIVFGTRAASQARSIAAVGGETKRGAYPIGLSASQLATLSTRSVAGAFAQHEVALDNSAPETFVQSAATDQTESNGNAHAPKIKAVADDVQKHVAAVSKVADAQQSPSSQISAPASLAKPDTKISNYTD